MEARDWELVKDLLDRGEGLDFRDEGSGDTVAHMAVRYERLDVLKKCGDFIDEENGEAVTPLEMALYNNYARIAHWLMDQNCKIRSGMLSYMPDFDRDDNDALLARLLNSGVDIHTPDEDGKYPIHHAASERQVDMLVARGAQVDVLDNQGRYPMVTNVRTYRAEGAIIALLKYAPCKAQVEQALRTAEAREKHGLVTCLRIALEHY